MTVAAVRGFLLWCTIINYGMLLFGMAFWTLARGSLGRIYSRLFHISVEQLDMLVFASLVVYKIGIVLFNMVPCIVLWIVA